MLDNFTPKSYLTLNIHNIQNYFYIKKPPQLNEMAYKNCYVKKV